MWTIKESVGQPNLGPVRLALYYDPAYKKPETKKMEAG